MTGRCEFCQPYSQGKGWTQLSVRTSFCALADSAAQQLAKTVIEFEISSTLPVFINHNAMFQKRISSYEQR